MPDFSFKEPKKNKVPYLTAADMMELKRALKKAREEVRKNPGKYEEFSK
ncbi:hypothetical protein HCH_02637 [Hahella chejuensis KCTC 2396]|uniref:Uncharacterized protein n=1 Tax=Hahella chejuensis (strain KCTC 2396) TaxID=349521 RepID=Q2SIU9_HAHCH|nr:hypothetical protein [Hahella chejuensis]ABC29425.1 hypothetical protein HCH_02637 [Hahella chejuensis KCTC 2396]